MPIAGSKLKARLMLRRRNRQEQSERHADTVSCFEKQKETTRSSTHKDRKPLFETKIDLCKSISSFT